MKDYFSRYSDTEFCHHGIKGQKWGVQNGPPYPLDSDISTGKRLKKENRAERKFEKNLKKAERSGNVSKAAAMKASKMTTEELAAAITRTQMEISMVEATNRLYTAYAESEERLNYLTNKEKIEKDKEKQDKKDIENKLKMELKIENAKAKNQLKLRNEQLKLESKWADKQNRTRAALEKKQLGQRQKQIDQQNEQRKKENSAKSKMFKLAESVVTKAASDVATDALKGVLTGFATPYKQKWTEASLNRSEQRTQYTVSPDTKKKILNPDAPKEDKKKENKKEE